MSSYFDYVRLRNFLREAGTDFAGLSEYAAPKQAARGRSLFADGRLRLALLTERCHFYYRARMRGVQVPPRLQSFRLCSFTKNTFFGGKKHKPSASLRLALLTERCHFYTARTCAASRCRALQGCWVHRVVG